MRGNAHVAPYPTHAKSDISPSARGLFFTGCYIKIYQPCLRTEHPRRRPAAERFVRSVFAEPRRSGLALLSTKSLTSFRAAVIYIGSNLFQGFQEFVF